jgi:hypothetical protein
MARHTRRFHMLLLLAGAGLLLWQPVADGVWPGGALPREAACPGDACCAGQTAERLVSLPADPVGTCPLSCCEGTGDLPLAQPPARTGESALARVPFAPDRAVWPLLPDQAARPSPPAGPAPGSPPLYLLVCSLRT